METGCNPVSFLAANSFPDIVHFFDAQHGVTIGDDDQIDTSRLEIYTTSDAGKTWQRVPDKNIPPTAGYAFSSNFDSYTVFQNRIWFTAGDTYGNSYIYRSDDFGKHWQLFPVYCQHLLMVLLLLTNKMVWVFLLTIGAPHEVETHDGGKTWANKSFTGYPMGLCITAIPFTHTLVSTISSGFTPVSGSSYSNDYGATWKVADTSSNFNSFAVAFLNPLIGWAGRADSPDPNGGMYKWKYQFSLDNNVIADDANTSTDNAIASTKTNTTSLIAYPNPVSTFTTISFNLQQSQKVSVTVYDMNGKLIKTLAGAQMQAGIHQLTWNAKDEKGNAVGSGIYSLKLQAGNYIEKKKVSVVH